MPAILLSVFLMLPYWAEANPVDSYHAKYKVSYQDSGVEIGSSSRTVTADSSGMVVSEHSLFPHPLLVVLGINPLSQTSQMRIDQNKVQSIRVVISTQGEEMVESADFNWENRDVTLHNGEKLIMPSSEMYDVESWLISLMIDPFTERSGSAVSLVENNKIQTYVYDEIKSNSIVLDGKTYEILIFEIQSAMGKDRSITVTMSPEFGEFPLRIVTKKDDFILNFELVSVERLQ